MKEPRVLLESISNGIALLSWSQDSFAIAESYDETADRYPGLRAGQQIDLPTADSGDLIVKPEIARQQLVAESKSVGIGVVDTGDGDGPDDEELPGLRPSAMPKRFHGSISLNPARVGRDAGNIAQEVIAHLEGLSGADVTVTLEISANVPDGTPENIVRVVNENCQTLKFQSHGFETE